MNFAFLVAAHTDAKQVERMVKCLLEVGDVYVHIDAKTEDGSVMERLNEVKKHLSDKTQLSVYQRVKVYWGGVLAGSLGEVAVAKGNSRVGEGL